jgi:hypothetical protein
VPSENRSICLYFSCIRPCVQGLFKAAFHLGLFGKSIILKTDVCFYFKLIAVGLTPTHIRKRHFLSHLYIKCIILPRQARDKHRENSKKSAVFPQVLEPCEGQPDVDFTPTESVAQEVQVWQVRILLINLYESRNSIQLTHMASFI